MGFEPNVGALKKHSPNLLDEKGIILQNYKINFINFTFK